MGWAGAEPQHEVIEINELRTSPSFEATHTVVEERFLAYHHLSADEAHRRLLTAADEVVSEYRAKASNQQSITAPIFKQSTVFSALSALGLIAFFVYARLESSPYQWRATASLVEAVLLLAALVWNVWLQMREWRLTSMEMSMRIQSIVEPLRKYGHSRKPDLKFPTAIPTVSISRVIRDQSVYTLPFNLIVEDDIVQMAYGDIAPCRIKYVSSHFDNAPGTEDQEYILEKGQLFKPILFASPNPTLMRRAALNEGQFHFRAMETPLRDTLKKALNFQRPETVIARQFVVIRDYYFTRLFWVVLGAALLINILRYSIKAAVHSELRDQSVEMLVVLQIYTILPILPLVVPTLFVILRSYGNAQILSLFDALQTSKTEFEDQEDVDEFDAAPPPTKDLVLDWGLVWKRFLDQFTNVDVTFLARTTGLVASLANTTVICAIDREGTISLPTPSVEQLFFFDESGDPVVLDVAEDSSDHVVRFHDKNWQEYISSLKPLGLNLLLNTDCGASLGRIRLDHHRKSNGMHLHGRVKSARQACLCQVGRQIGFSSDSLKSFVYQKAIHAFAPYQANLSNGPEYHFEIPSFFAQVFKEAVSETYQLFSEGNVDLIMESCSDYWNGRGLGTMDEAAEKKIFEFYQNAIISDAQIVAYSYRPIQHPATLISKTTHPPIRPNADSIYLELDNPIETISKSSSLNKLSDTEKSPSGRPRSKGNRKRYLSNIDRLQTPGEGKKQVYHEIVKGQTFLSMASLAFLPKANVIDFIEDLGLAGIRFVYFSSAPERESKAYAERLGLEIDWNSCILLSPDNGSTPGYLELHDMKARLPRGVDKIRDHIENVDDVPLHVSLFAECSSYSVREMVRIFQEHGEVVCCVGSSLNEMNVECFALADISIAIDPLSVLKARNHAPTGPLSPLNVGAGFTSLPCAFSLHNDTSIYSLSQIIREARTIADHGRQAVVFYLSSQTCLCLIMILSYCLLFPPIFTGYQLFWLLWIILPPLSLSFMFSPHDPRVMTTMPVKNTHHLKDRWRFVVYFLIRFSVPVVLCVAVFAISLSVFKPDQPSDSVFGDFGVTSWMHLSDGEQWALLYAQNCTLFVWTELVKVCISATCLHRIAHFKSFPPYRNRVWVGSAVTSLVLQTAFFAISIAARGPYSLSLLPWWLFVIVFVGGPVLAVGVQEAVKVHDRREWERFQKRSKLEFNTKL
ncbi:hypothetical protein SpCBS45565_g00930 [Spizellomyces sp. 'palustris']|nr:hypothetical protein SpCBS45565_g00930 [Spizellomyces sp. 'palustris']